MTPIEQKTVEIIASLSAVDEKILPTDRMTDIGFDSLKMVELVIALEETFEVLFDISALDPSKLQTVADFIGLVRQTVSD